MRPECQLCLCDVWNGNYGDTWFYGGASSPRESRTLWLIDSAEADACKAHEAETAAILLRIEGMA